MLKLNFFIISMSNLLNLHLILTILLTKRVFFIMSKRVFALVSGIIGGLQTIGVAIVTYTSPDYATAINSAIVIAGAAAIEICNLFVTVE